MPSQPLREFAVPFERHELWRTLWWADILFRYRRTMLGPFWLTLSTGVMVFGVGLLYAGLLQQDIASYLPSLAIGVMYSDCFGAISNFVIIIVM